MKRYWLSILMAVLAVSGIATYYSYGKLGLLPEYRLEMIQGDAKEGEVIDLSGSYYLKWSSEFLSVSPNGSEYDGHRDNIRKNVLDGDSWLYDDSNMKQMIKDHKSFMRGKKDRGGFYRDDEWIIYANVSLENKKGSVQTAIFQLNILNEATEKDSKFKFSYETPKLVDYIHIRDVQRVDDLVHLLVDTEYNDRNNDRNTSEYEMLIIDMNSGKLLNKKKIDSWDMKFNDQKDVQIHVGVITHENVMAPTETILFYVLEVQKIKDEENDENSVTLSENYFAYSYRTGLVTNVPDSLVLKPNFYSVSSLQDDYYYIAEFSDTSPITLSKYNLKTKHLEQAYATLSKTGDEAVIIKNNRLYRTNPRAAIPGASVYNLSTGELLYTGRVVEVGEDKETPEEMKENLNLNNITIIP